MQIMKALNYLRSTFLTCGGSIRKNGLAWIIFVLLFLSDWKFAVLFWIIPMAILVGLEFWKFERVKHDWEIILTPVINFYFLSALIFASIIEWIGKHQ